MPQGDEGNAGTGAPSTTAEKSAAIGGELGFEPGDVVLELGYDEDVDFDLREAIEAAIDGELEDEDFQEVADVVLLWWRSDDDDLTDGLVDAIASLDGGHIWLLTPKAKRPGHIPPAEIAEAAKTAGLSVMTPISAGDDWSGTKLKHRKK